MNCLARTAATAFTAVAAAIAPASTAQAYPIDCAILLCLAGGFPASAECTAAKIEMIRRITPFPIEPPLQLWNCPMGMDASVAAAAGITPPALGRDGMTAEARAYRDAIEIYHVRYRRERVGGGEGDEWVERDDTERGEYDRDGDYGWEETSFTRGPAWLGEIPGASRREITRDRNGEEQVVGHENYAARRLRGIAMRYRDYSGTYHFEWVSY